MWLYAQRAERSEKRFRSRLPVRNCENIINELLLTIETDVLH